MNSGRFLFLPNGRGPSYRWHLQCAEFQVFLECCHELMDTLPSLMAIDMDSYRVEKKAIMYIALADTREGGGKPRSTPRQTWVCLLHPMIQLQT